MQLLIKKLEQDAKLPVRAHKEDAGADIFSYGEQTVMAGETKKLRTGISFAIPEGYAFLIWDKSSIGSAGIKTLGGVFDAGYRGEVLIIVHNLTKTSVTFAHGQKIAQVLIQKVELPEIVEVDSLDDTLRGANGFGSTGK
jgi:dUTP pyrophosphatase